MEFNKVKCGQCNNLRKGEGIDSFISPQGIHTTLHRGRYHCEADISRHFTDEQISALRECPDSRPRTLTFGQELKQHIFHFVKQIFPMVLGIIKSIFMKRGN